MARQRLWNALPPDPLGWLVLNQLIRAAALATALPLLLPPS